MKESRSANSSLVLRQGPKAEENTILKGVFDMTSGAREKEATIFPKYSKFAFA